ncbi:hypothetical protein evm_001563 [Chilo suppressalis]|nr:hypothetical protein evm_001563 [Chilo suppressalis]
MMFVKRTVLVLQIVIIYVSSESNSEPRRGRLFSFNSKNEDIKIDLEFSIPFVSIPVKQTMESAFGLASGYPLININPTSLVFGGAVLLVTTTLVPWLLKSYTVHNPQKKYFKCKYSYTTRIMESKVKVVLFKLITDLCPQAS